MRIHITREIRPGARHILRIPVGVFGLLLGLTGMAGLAQPTISGQVVRVVDGDSLYLQGHPVQIRLWGVDAPERHEPGYQSAADYLYSIAHGKRVDCLQMDEDKYGRAVARCFLRSGDELNRLMIVSGRAREYKRFSHGFYSR